MTLWQKILTILGITPVFCEDCQYHNPESEMDHSGSFHKTTGQYDQCGHWKHSRNNKFVRYNPPTSMGHCSVWNNGGCLVYKEKECQK